MTTLLPGCMMPDGAEPCDAFTELQDDRDRLKAVNDDLLPRLDLIMTIACSADATDEDCARSSFVRILHQAHAAIVKATPANGE